jgi:hypothetical protein
MSERTPGPRRGKEPDDWLEHSGSSVFGKGRDPSPPPAPPPAPPGPPPRTWNPAPWAPVTRGGPPPPEPPLPARTWDPAPWATATRAGSPRTDVPGRAPPRPGGAPPAGPDGWPPPRPADRGDAGHRGAARGRPSPAPRPRGPRSPGGGDADRAGGTGLRSPLGLGAVVGLSGLVAFLAALLVLPWFTAGGEGVTLADIRSAFTVAATDPGDVVPGAGEQTGSTLPEGIPTPDEVTDAAEQQARDAAGTAAAAAIDSGRSRYLELYTDVLWLGVAGVVAAAALASTLLAPRSAALSLLLGVRRIAGAATVLAALIHGAALWVVFSGDGAPSPAFGVWLGLAGLAAVVAGCVIGPRR